MKKIILVTIANLFAIICMAQIYAEPITGYQIDLNNNSRFKQINSGVQFSFKKSKHHEFLLQLQKSWPINFVSGDASFTLNPALPLYANAKKIMRPSSWSFGLGHRITLAHATSKSIFSLLIFTGFTAQKISVSYQYDKNDYTVLNPDQTQKKLSIYLSGGIEYMRLLNYGRLFFQLNAATAPIGRKINYPASFVFMAPLIFNAGYSIPLQKNKHGKN